MPPFCSNCAILSRRVAPPLGEGVFDEYAEDGDTLRCWKAAMRSLRFTWVWTFEVVLCEVKKKLVR
jgi:hypothetical protein